MLLSQIYVHPRDLRVSLVEGENFRYYLIDGKKNEYLSTTERLAVFWNKKFDKDRFWGPPGNPYRIAKEQLNIRACNFGTYSHKQFERYENGLEFEYDPKWPKYHCYEDLPNWDKFMQFKASLESYWKVFRTEWIVFTKTYNIASPVDVVYRDTRFPEKYVLMIVDYKTSKDPLSFYCDCKERDDPNKQNPDPMQHTEDCSAVGRQPVTRDRMTRKCNKDFNQVCIYSKIIEDLYGDKKNNIEIEVAQAIVVYLNPEWPLYIHTDDRHNFEAITEAIIKFQEKKNK